MKQLQTADKEKGTFVAPLAGAWVETDVDCELTMAMKVAPLAGAWVETQHQRRIRAGQKSRPSRARGLKPERAIQKRRASRSRPSRARGLKHIQLQRGERNCYVAPLAGAWVET